MPERLHPTKRPFEWQVGGPNERLLSADSVEKLGFASDAEILEEYCLILRAICSLG